ncbi:hypothetical protein CYMTET_19678 [Cymbomonas tetramitiformis]|uniref:Uncharacterized protein n=1 Tax=Cymbomonas tetramitiformis TaxID=36881 RepID=A0AAE0L519_9CHLO|nr:hypothetical protein CYMTET_19678 [Cymbomonas tetramitiformis]
MLNGATVKNMPKLERLPAVGTLAGGCGWSLVYGLGKGMAKRRGLNEEDPAVQVVLAGGATIVQMAIIYYIGGTAPASSLPMLYENVNCVAGNHASEAFFKLATLKLKTLKKHR